MEQDNSKLEKEVLLENISKDRLFDLMVDIQTESAKFNKRKDFLIGLLIVLMAVEAIAGFITFAWYESQFGTVTTETIDVYTEGDNANAEYNDVEGNQYNDNSTHNEQP